LQQVAPAASRRIQAPRVTDEAALAGLAKALAMPELRERYISMGLEPVGNTPEEFGAQIRGDIARWAKIARMANVRGTAVHAPAIVRQI
jgi:tripartite-type tricarboxylate transporter receptor subunit TctC